MRRIHEWGSFSSSDVGRAMTDSSKRGSRPALRIVRAKWVALRTRRSTSGGVSARVGSNESPTIHAEPDRCWRIQPREGRSRVVSCSSSTLGRTESRTTSSANSREDVDRSRDKSARYVTRCGACSKCVAHRLVRRTAQREKSFWSSAYRRAVCKTLGAKRTRRWLTGSQTPTAWADRVRSASERPRCVRGV